MQRTPPELTSLARSMRANPTEAERRLWLCLRAYGPRFTRQLVIGHFIVDLACREARIAVELDGGHHALRVDNDAERTAYLNALGWQVLRFWNNDVQENIDGVVAIIVDAVAKRSTHPRPLPSREGRTRRPRPVSRQREGNSKNPLQPTPDAR